MRRLAARPLRTAGGRGTGAAPATSSSATAPPASGEATAPAASGEATNAAPPGWIGGLDGLRAVAVLAVIAFHLNPGYLTGGFLGVDLFFVISGYLITRLLLAEHRRTGRIGIAGFYRRRARRLLPPVLLLLGVTGAAGYLLWPDQRPTLPGSIVSSLGYANNWWQIADRQSYFVTMGRPPMLQHLWSLAIEEQYYLLWAPLVVAVIGAWAGRRWMRRRSRRGNAGPTARGQSVEADPALRGPLLLAGVAAGLALASTAAMAVIATVTNVPYQADSSRVYFGTDTHAMGLLLSSAAGALVGLPWWGLRRRVPRWVRPAWRDRWERRPLLPASLTGAGGRGGLPVWATDAATLAAGAAMMWIFIGVDEYRTWLYRGGFLLFAAVAVAVVCGAARPGSRVGRALDAAPLKWIGRRSYGIYLWHWPVFVVTRPVLDVQGPAWLIDIARTGLAVALAAASYRYVEMPIRQGRLRGRRVAVADRRGMLHRRQWAIPALVMGCAAILLAGHFSVTPQPVWASPAPPANPGPVSPPDSAPPDPGMTMSSPVFGPPLAAGPAGGPSTASPTPGPVPGFPTGDPAPDPPAQTIAPAVVAHTPVPTPLASSQSPRPPSPSPPPRTPSSVVPLSPTPGPPGTSSSAIPRSPTPGSPQPKPAAPAPTRSKAAVSAFGDSVLLGASPAVRSAVGSLSLDAVVGRQAWDTLDDVAAAHRAGRLAPVVLIHTGNNGVISAKQLAATLSSLRDRTAVILVNDHVDRPWEAPNNTTLASIAVKYPHVRLIDWHGAGARHPSWFRADGIHVNPTGAQGYARLVAAAIG